jgi:hypothetical protein
VAVGGGGRKDQGSSSAPSSSPSSAGAGHVGVVPRRWWWPALLPGGGASSEGPSPAVEVIVRVEGRGLGGVRQAWIEQGAGVGWGQVQVEIVARPAEPPLVQRQAEARGLGALRPVADFASW